MKECRHVRPRASCMSKDCRERWREAHQWVRRLDEERQARESITRHDEANISEITGYRFRF